MKSFRDVLNGRMRTGKGRFVLASVGVHSLVPRQPLTGLLTHKFFKGGATQTGKYRLRFK
jgi:hypothetical protein